MTFREYVTVRKYDFGRGSRSSWSFIAFARGKADFPEITSWRSLESYLLEAAVEADIVDGARSAWSSFTAYRSRVRNKPGSIPRAESALTAIAAI